MALIPIKPMYEAKPRPTIETPHCRRIAGQRGWPGRTRGLARRDPWPPRKESTTIVGPIRERHENGLAGDVAADLTVRPGAPQLT
jgi:hypothetical protein